ncbi:MAG: phosphoribosylanthranilate isomerase [Acidobacteria bacterium]|nr:phosphoribosylanthranilate isomerase [Acidobacteriota bacterium]
MWVKICANTSVEDARLAVEFAADAVGFIFAPSKRQVAVAQVAEMTAALPDALEKIGVFYSTDADELLNAVRACRLTGVQLHSEFEPGLVERLRVHFGDTGESVSILQTVHWNTSLPAEEQEEHFLQQLSEIDAQGLVSAILVDSKTAHASGGTGVQFDWQAAARALRNAKTRMVVAGGLNPANVAEAIRSLEPWGVDVASGSEISPGKKDAEKVRNFIHNAKAAQAKPTPLSSAATI